MTRLAQYGGRRIKVDGQPAIEMRDPNDNAKRRYQYRAADAGIERRVLRADGSPYLDTGSPWEPMTDADLASLEAAHGAYHPILDEVSKAAAILGRKGGSVVGRGRGASKRRGGHVVQWLSSGDVWEYPGCSREEATFPTRAEADAAVAALRSDPDWADGRFRVERDAEAVSAHMREVRAKRRTPQTYTSDGERGGYTAREGLRGWVVEGWSRVAGERTGWRCLVSYAPPFEPSLRLDGLASGPGGAVVHAEMIYEAARQAIAAGAPVGKPLILGVRVLRRGHVVR